MYPQQQNHTIPISEYNIFIENQQEKQHQYPINHKNKLKVVSKTFVIAFIVILLGVYPINNWMVFSTIFAEDGNIINDNNRIMKEQKEEQPYKYCILQQDIIDSIAVASSVDDELASTSINSICNYSNNTVSKKIISLYSSTLANSFFFSFSSPFSKSKKFVHSSIRLEEEIFRSLQKEAERQGISLSSLINKTLKNYIMSDIHFEELGFLLISKDFLRKTLAELHDEKKIKEVGRELGLTVAKEYVDYFFPNVNAITLAQFLKIWFKRFHSFKHRVDGSTINNNNNYNDKNQDVDVIKNKDIKDKKEEKEEEEEDNYLQRQRQEETHSFSLYHDININFSFVLKAILEGLIEPIINSPVTFKELTANSISFSFSSFSSNKNN
jgi:hypothetical protein